jgi:predicted  nucleic acid-binding Zn-ribbon protein
MALTASPADQAKLLDLQDLDNKLQQLENRGRALPELAKLAGLAGELDERRRLLTERTGVLEDAKRELGRLESDVALVEQRMTRDTDRLRTATSTKDVTALEHELASLTRRRSDLEDIELDVMQRVEDAEVGLAEARAAFDDTVASRRTLEETRDAALEQLALEKRHTTANRETVAAELPADLLDLYERQRARYGWGASLLRGGVSSASGVALGANEMAKIRAAAPDEVLLCPDSSAILVRTAESGLEPTWKVDSQLP